MPIEKRIRKTILLVAQGLGIFPATGYILSIISPFKCYEYLKKVYRPIKKVLITC